MNILNLLNYAPEFGGGLSKHLAALGAEFKSIGDNLYLGFPEKKDWQNSLSSTAEILIVPEIKNPLLSGFPKIIRNICRSKSIDLIHMHFKFAQPFAIALSLKKWDIPIVYHWHNPPESLNNFITPKNFKGNSKRIIAGLIARYTDKKVIKHHISISKNITTMLVHNRWTLLDKITYLPNAVQRRNPADVGTRFKIGSPVIIGTVANFRPEKDYETLLRGFKILIESDFKSELWMVGDGPTKSAMENFANELGIGSLVKFLGTLKDPTEIYKNFDVFVLSTRYEGYSLVLLEAMSYGLPIVASSVSSIPDIINNGLNGILVKPGDAKDLARALTKILTDNLLYTKLSEASLENYYRQLSHSEWAHSLVVLYNRLLNVN